MSRAPGASSDGLGKALLDERQDLFAYAISFAVIGRFWLIHHRFFGEVIRFDGRLIVLNLWVILSGLLMFVDARRAGLTRTSPEEARAGTRSALIVASVFAISIPVAVVSPHLAPYCWLALFFGPFIARFFRARSSS